jgi:hypothetical protein
MLRFLFWLTRQNQIAAARVFFGPPLQAGRVIRGSGDPRAGALLLATDFSSGFMPQA